MIFLKTRTPVCGEQLCLPGTEWKNTNIVIQAGFIKPDGTPQILEGNPYQHTDGKTYHVFGSADRT